MDRTTQKGRNSCLWLQSRSVLSSFGVVLMSCKVNFHVVRSVVQYSACRIKNKIYLYLKKGEKKNDDNNDHCIENRRHKMVFLDKKQGWYHIVVPEEATQIVKMGKGKVGKLRGFKKDSCTAEECKRLQNHVIFGALVMLTNANSSD